MTYAVFTWAHRHGVSQSAVAELLDILNPDIADRVAGPERSESAVQANIQIEAAKRGVALWRNNSGACTDDRGRLVRYGLANTSTRINAVFKSSDLIGITPTQIGDRVVGIFTAIEVKSPGWSKPTNDREVAQDNFLRHVRAMGGIGKFAQSVGDVYAP